MHYMRIRKCKKGQRQLCAKEQSGAPRRKTEFHFPQLYGGIIKEVEHAT